MDRHNDGFQDNSYEELLNQYAGERIGNSASTNKVSNNEPKKVVKKTVVTEKPKSKPLEKPVFNIDTTKKSPTVNPYGYKTIDTTNGNAPVKKEPSVSTPIKREYKPVVEKRFNNETAKKSNKKFAMPKNIKFSRNSKTDNSAPKKENPSAKEFLNGLLYVVKARKRAFIAFGCCFIVAGILSGILISCINDVLAINRDNTEIVQVELPNNAKTGDAVKALHDAGLIKNKLFCKMFIGVMDAIDSRSNKNPAPYLPGVYYFDESMGVEKMIKRFKTSAVRGATISITIPEGYTINQVIAKLEKNKICSADSLYKTFDEVDFSSEYDFIDKLTYKEKRYHVLEGYIFPATYEFEQGTDPATVVRTFLNTFKKRWDDNYAERANEISMSVDDVIKIASIVEKEAADKPQFALVSSVIHNRLNRSGLYPTLGCDATRKYVDNTIKNAKHPPTPSKLSEYYRNYDSDQCVGLPASPICNPGDDAIDAALYPENTQYYFFAHDKNKKIYMAKTVDEHDKNLAQIGRVNATIE